MIVPRHRLLYAVSLIVVPAAVIGALAPATATACAAVSMMLFAVAVVDAVSSLGLLRQVSVYIPPVLRLAKDREDAIPVRIEHGPRAGTLMRVGLPLPIDFEAPQEDLWAQLPADAEASQVQWACTPRRRGRYLLSDCHLECGSRLGLWAVRTIRSVQSELRVYPNLQSERHLIAPLLMRRSLGAHLQRQVGQGREFEKLRDYQPGDSSDEIHWKASGKRGRLISKVFQVERTQEVYLIMDSSRLTARLCAQPATTVLERYVLASLVMALATEQQGDLFGLVTFSDRIHGFVRARNGKEHYGACRDALLTLQPRLVTPDYDELFTFLRLRLRKRALLLFLTELDDPLLAEQFLKHVALLSRQHLVLVNMVQPESAHPLFTGPEVTSEDGIYQELGHHLQWRRLRELAVQLQQKGVRFSLLDPNTLSLDLATLYRNVKQRQLI